MHLQPERKDTRTDDTKDGTLGDARLGETCQHEAFPRLSHDNLGFGAAGCGLKGKAALTAVSIQGDRPIAGVTGYYLTGNPGISFRGTAVNADA